MDAYWPWWLGALALAAVTVGFWRVMGRPFGVSGICGRFVDIRMELAAERRDAAMDASPDAALAALEAMTREQFGEAPAGSSLSPASGDDRSVAAALRPRPRLAVHATFLIAIAVGAFFACLARGRLGAVHGMGPTFAAFFGVGWKSLAVLAAGGVLVGFGTTLAGGCTSGHGLTGCGRLDPVSLLATAFFFGTAILVSLLLLPGVA